MKAIIVGSSGFVGKHLQHTLKNMGYSVTGVDKEDSRLVFDEFKELFEGANIIINLAGAPIVSRWSKDYKELLYSSRIDTTERIIEVIKELEIKPQLFISTSAVGIYSNRDVHSEQSLDYADDFLSKLCQDWENRALDAQDLGVRTAIFRYGIVLGDDGGALKQMLPPFKFGVGGVIGSGKQGFSFIHIDDLMSAYKFIIENSDSKGIYNLSAPEPTTNRGLTKALGKALHRPTIFPLPEFVLQIIFGEGSRVLTDGQQMIPQKLLDEGFKFKYKNIDEAVASLI